MIVQSLLKISLLGATWVLYLLLGLSVVSIGATLERVLFFRKNKNAGKDLDDKLEKAGRREFVDGKHAMEHLDRHRGRQRHRRGPQHVDAQVEPVRQRGLPTRGLLVAELTDPPADGGV